MALGKLPFNMKETLKLVTAIALVIAASQFSIFGQTRVRFKRGASEQIQTGMTYEEAVKIIGSEGAMNLDSYSATNKTSSYKWEGNGRMSISLKDGKISSKSQGNLK